MEVPKAEQGSWEEVLHKLNPGDKIVLSKDLNQNKLLRKPIGHRAIGVVYHPEALQYPYFVPSIISKRYNAFIFIDNTTALHPIKIKLRNEAS
jgi:erythromycin esterase-like protein